MSGIRGIRMWQGLFLLGVAGIGVAYVPAARAGVDSTMPDFYSTPGLNPFRDQVAANLTETVDPFSGALQLSYIDLVVPGNGGLDIEVRRIYNSSNVYYSRTSGVSAPPTPDTLFLRTPYGIGWTMHFGRVVKGTGIGFDICFNDESDTLDNPVLELPDGRKEIFFANDTAFDSGSSGAIYITKSQWVAYCLGSGSGLLVISPEGIKYTMDRLVQNADAPFGGLGVATFYTTRIEDPNGNWLSIQYKSLTSAGTALIDRITSNDGRQVDFTYYDSTSSLTVRLQKISTSGQSWYYYYDTYFGNPGYYFLNRVRRPDGLDWKYNYHTALSTQKAHDNLMKKVTYPHDGTVTYDYDYECLNSPGGVCSFSNGWYYTIVVSSKTNGGRDVTSGTWNYNYNQGDPYDTTTVTLPNGRGKYVYKHYSWEGAYFSTTVADLFLVGLLKEKSIFDENDTTPIHKEEFTWGYSVLSNELFTRPPYNIYTADPKVYLPVLYKKVITRNGETYTTQYSDFDASANPQTVVETGISSQNGYAQPVTRTTDLTYFPRNPGQNIVRRVEDEIVNPCISFGCGVNGDTERTFSSTGDLTKRVRYGVREDYSYYSNGDLKRKTDARGNFRTYQSYYRGIPRTELHPEGVTIARTVNNSGGITSETNGRGFITNYGVNGMNQVTSIDHPRGSDVTVVWLDTGRTVTRATHLQTVTFDGFGRISDTTTEGIAVDIDYDELGHKAFESYPGTTSGRTYETDVLGRVTKVTHADGQFRRVQYFDDNRVRITNERGYYNWKYFRSYGNPDQKELVRKKDASSTPEETITTFYRDANRGLVTQVSQNGVSRNYSYTSTGYVLTVTDPETGVTTFTRDANGNMKSRQVGTAPFATPVTNFVYDDLDRLQDIDYPGTTPDAHFEYDDNDNLESVSRTGGAAWNYTYDENDNLQTETLTISGQPLPIVLTRSYTALDFLDTITYPSGRVVNYAPNDLGRPTQVAPYINSPIAYHPDGQPQSLTYANGRTATLLLDTRNRADTMSVTGSVLDLNYGYDGIGNISTVTDGLDAGNNRTITYDGVDRMKTASGVWGGGNVGYDALGNIQTKTIGAQSLSYSITASNNRLSSVSGDEAYNFSYDFYGNVTGNGRFTFTYDDAYHLRTVKDPSNNTVATMEHDGNNRRVKMTKGGTTKFYAYGKDGNLLGEYEAADKFKEYVYLKGRLVAAFETRPDLPPVADAGPDQSVKESTNVSLDGTGSSDADGALVTYAWQQTAGSPDVSLSGAGIASPSFTAPLVQIATVLTFQLTVTDDDGLQHSDSVDVTVQDAIPTANAGADQNVFENDVVSLNGTGSSDPDGTLAGYQWIQTGGPEVTLTGGTTATPSFTAPAVTAATTLTFQLTVTDTDGFTDNDPVDINVQNAEPVADAGSDQAVNEGAAVALNGTGSSDPNGSIASYAWQQTGGAPTVSLSGASTATPSFPAPAVLAPATLTFQLTVTDDDSLQDIDTVDVAVANSNPDDDSDGLPDAWEIQYFGNLSQDGTGNPDTDPWTNLQEYTRGTDPSVVDGCYVDVPTGHGAYSYVEALAAAGISADCDAVNFYPNTVITRDTVAIWLVKAIEGGAYTPPPATGTVYTDVSTGTLAADWIEELASAARQIAEPCAAGRYCPRSVLSNDLATKLLLKATNPVGYTPPAATISSFADVNIGAAGVAGDGDYAADWIEQLQAQGDADFCDSATTRFCPREVLTHADLARMLVKTFNLVP